MSRGDLNSWIVDLAEISSIYIFSGSEGLWFVLCVIVFLWFVLAIYRVEKSNQEKIDEELGSKEDLNSLIDLFHQDNDEKDQNN
tara:strand:+ start:2510 stop:2761 length:252 start_codon:yes stop_codon:yes gene_type:complete